MAKSHPPQKANLFTGLIHNPAFVTRDQVINALEQHFGKIALISTPIPFDFTDYYYDEMGQPLIRFWVGYVALISPDELADKKLLANEIETEFSDAAGNRKLNIDPGYLVNSKVILASCKNYYHRIYMQDGVYAELEYQYKAGSFEPYEWTYPDYATERAIDFFNSLREKYRALL